ncbi:MAG: enoyl-CoA hydratase/isomerase family protein [Gammaproteobacteria bacterium]|nr:enoyl-CoA hydratase/isomerase family protein [Gammaproteobacteria bacterium]
MSASENVLVTRRGHVCEVRLNRPEKRNALTSNMYEALIEAFAEAESDDEIRVLLLSGEGACFTGGNDLKDFLTAPAVIESDHVISRFLRALSGFGKILIAAAHGPTVGIGVTLLLHCDLVIAAARSTRLITPFVQLGVVPEAASTLLLPRLLGHQRAAEMFFLGEPLDAKTAKEWGLVNRVVDDEALMAEARSLADGAARQPPGAVRATKRLIRAAESAEVTAHMQEELRVFTERLRSAEFAAAAQAFFGKSAGRAGGGT